MFVVGMERGLRVSIGIDDRTNVFLIFLENSIPTKIVVLVFGNNPREPGLHY